MNTLFLIMAEFETAEIPLEELAEKYLGLNSSQARRRAARQALPFPVHRGSNSQKAPWLVHAKDLADHIDKQRSEGHREWKKVRDVA
ncbi:pyocin activator PrtN family protein [Alloalcanivorax xenomutans]|uniref:pyocin activator PrtN family protein n=1 Tax=Alloalcanivorax xenomutans TaxID=1094342 RepID=UPI003B96A428